MTAWMNNLYPFQIEAVKFHMKHRYTLNCAEMGLGKSRMGLATAKAVGMDATVFCPAFLKPTWQREAEAIGVNAEVHSYSMLHKVKATSKFWIADECFDAGTRVDTPIGPRLIEDIRVGDEVLSAAGVDVVAAIMETTSCRRAIINGMSCTPNHPFLTWRGWVCAGELRIGDILVRANEAVRMVQGPLHGEVEGEGHESESVLREILLSEMAHEATQRHSQGSYPRDSGEGGSKVEGAQEPSIIRVASVEQLYEEARGAGEAVQYLKGYEAQTSCARGERQRPHQARIPDVRDAGAGVEAELCSNLGGEWETPSVQDRYSAPASTDCNRSRWGEPQLPYCETEGLKETTGARGVRVESVTVQECRSRITYNLQVKGHPSYSVNGVLVHNCHALKNPTAKRTQQFYKMLKEVKPDYLIGLTGTPIKNRLPDFWSLLAFMSQVPIKGINGLALEGQLQKYYQFCRYFCKSQRMEARGRSFEKFYGVQESKIPELKALLKDKYIRFEVSKVLQDLPTMTKKFVEMDLAPSEELQELFDAYMQGSKVDITGKVKSAALKAEFTANYVSNILDENDEESVVVFTDHLDSAAIIHGAIPRSALITGKTPMKERQVVVDYFQDKKIKVIVATIGALSTGVTLHAARHVVFNDWSWTPSDNLQAEKRIHRIGQKNACFSHHIVASATDRHIFKVLESKLDTMRKVLDA